MTWTVCWIMKTLRVWKWNWRSIHISKANIYSIFTSRLKSKVWLRPRLVVSKCMGWTWIYEIISSRISESVIWTHCIKSHSVIVTSFSISLDSSLYNWPTYWSCIKTIQNPSSQHTGRSCAQYLYTTKRVPEGLPPMYDLTSSGLVLYLEYPTWSWLGPQNISSFTKNP